MAQIQIVVLTPETTTLDQMVDAVTIPLIDGEAGIMPGHAPMIGRLGPGELRVTEGSSTNRFYVDGGFAQIDNNVVSVLTGQSIPAAEIDLAAARKALEAAEYESTKDPQLAAIRAKTIAQARAKVQIAERA